MGNKASVFKTLAASSHSNRERQRDDYYATEPKATELLLKEETFAPVIWECACGEGHMAKVLEAHGYQVISTDLVYRGYDHLQRVDSAGSGLCRPRKEPVGSGMELQVEGSRQEDD